MSDFLNANRAEIDAANMAYEAEICALYRKGLTQPVGLAEIRAKSMHAALCSAANFRETERMKLVSDMREAGCVEPSQRIEGKKLAQELRQRHGAMRDADIEMCDRAANFIERHIGRTG